MGSADKVFLNGELVPKDDARVSIDTVAFKYGAMVFEGLRGYWNETRQELFVFRLNDHSHRLRNSVQVMRMETDLREEDFSKAVLDVLRANSVKEDVHIRQMMYVAGSGQMFETGPIGHAIVVNPNARWFSEEIRGIPACVSSWQRISDMTMPPRVKCAANYQNGRLALLQARLDGYQAAIFLNSAGKVAEEPRGCVFILREGRLATPKITDGILESITRKTLIQLCQERLQMEVAERDIDRTELYLAEEAFVCGSGLEVTPVISIDGHLLGKGCPGEKTTTIREIYLAVARGELSEYSDWVTPVYGAER
ncbi:MAG: aminotransferase class IV [Acidobacteria bacterium]|nr:aminotransferase class IV [Acidobacteriota bacterium]MCI0720809.1 aminotransferase class IV [Acidobacteriota bacterium]